MNGPNACPSCFHDAGHAHNCRVLALIREMLGDMPLLVAELPPSNLSAAERELADKILTKHSSSPVPRVRDVDEFRKMWDLTTEDRTAFPHERFQAVREQIRKVAPELWVEPPPVSQSLLDFVRDLRAAEAANLIVDDMLLYPDGKPDLSGPIMSPWMTDMRVERYGSADGEAVEAAPGDPLFTVVDRQTPS